MSHPVQWRVSWTDVPTSHAPERMLDTEHTGEERGGKEKKFEMKQNKEVDDEEREGGAIGGRREEGKEGGGKGGKRERREEGKEGGGKGGRREGGEGEGRRRKETRRTLMSSREGSIIS